MADDFEAQVAGIAILSDAIRRALYLFVAHSQDAVSRDQAAAVVGVQRAVTAFHLEKLVEEGLLEFEFKRLTGRSGPGAGRPAKLYRRAGRQIAVSLPPREYDVAGLLLAGAIEAAGSSGRPAREELERISYEYGQKIGERARSRAGARAGKAALREAVLEVLGENGFEPRVVGREVVLANCPFHALAQQFTALVCGMNLHLLQGVRGALDGGDGELVPRLEPTPGLCCVKFCREAAPKATAGSG